jgi:6,7-dimethyl-8-ribityllumazine synthase
MARSRTASSSPEQRTSQFRPGIVESVFPARITTEHLKASLAELERLGHGPIWLIDTTVTTSFESGCIPLATTTLLQFKKKGLKRVVAVIPSAVVRMGARAVAMASSVDMRIVERRLDAMPLLAL